MEKETGIILLAAGNSSRLGKPKQLLQFSDTNLLRHVVSEAVQLADENVIVVTGAYREAIENQLTDFPVTTVYNPHWEHGMGSSIAIGIQQLLLLNPLAQACILAVCDQPFVTKAVFERLIEHFKEDNKHIAASAYANTLGTPVLFGSRYFPDLLQLQGADGAKKLLETYNSDVVAVEFEKGVFDIDTEADYQQLMNRL